MRKVTVVLLNYKRPVNVLSIIEALRRQTVEAEIMLIDNSQDDMYKYCPSGNPNDLPSHVGMVAGTVDRWVKVPWNAKCYIRIPFSLYAEGDYVMWLDDDIIPSSDDFIERALRIYRSTPMPVLGAWGRGIQDHHPFYDPEMISFCPIIKGRFVFFQKKLLREMPLVHDGPGHFAENEDIYLSLWLRRWMCRDNYASPELQRLLADLPVGNEGLVNRPGHFKTRHDFVEWWVKEYGEL